MPNRKEINDNQNNEQSKNQRLKQKAWALDDNHFAIKVQAFNKVSARFDCKRLYHNIIKDKFMSNVLSLSVVTTHNLSVYRDKPKS